MTTKILGAQIENFSITTEQLSSNVTNTFATSAEISNYATSSQLTGLSASAAPKITSVAIANSTFTILDDTAVDINGGYIVITGSNFAVGATVLVDTVTASAVTRVNSTTLRVQVPARNASTYNLFVVNPDGGTGIRVASITYSATPTWVTASPLVNQANNAPFAINLNATEATSYALAAGSTLPAGTTLLANGYFYGTVTVGVETVYSFNVLATDAELQDSSKTFGLTVNIIPPQRLWMWGSGGNGALGLNDTINRSSPVQVGTDVNWNKISAGQNHSVALNKNGTLWAWGYNGFGQLGFNNIVGTSSPVQLGTDTNWSIISATVNSTSAIKTNGTLWAWGDSSQGILGLNSIISRSSPVQVGTDTNWSKLSEFKGNGFAAIKTTGSLWVWGYGFFGIHGINTSINRSSPIQVGALTNWAQVAGSALTAASVKTDASLWTWGYNAYGELGRGIAANQTSSPIQVGTLTNWSKVVVGTNCVLARKTNGTLWAWGRNLQGQLGFNDRIDRSSPVQVGVLTNWSDVDISVETVLAKKSDGTLWSWGLGTNGQIGTNLAINRSSPVQIGSSTNWYDISINGNQAMAISLG